MSVRSRRRVYGAQPFHALALLGATAAVAIVPAAAEAAVTPAFEGEAMSLPASLGQVVGATGASNGKAMLIWSSGAATRAATMPEGKIVVRAKGQQCAGAPRMSVKVDGTEVLNVLVTATNWADYTAAAPRAPGSRTVSVAFTNDYKSSCDRNLFIDKVGVSSTSEPAPTPSPAPTPAPSPAPTPAPSPAPSTGRVIFDGDFSRGLTAWSTKIRPERISVVDDPILGSKRKVGKFTVYDSDTGPTENPRAQLEGPSNMISGGEYWVGWSTLFPSNFPALPSGGWMTLESVYGAPYAGTGPLGTKVGADDLQFQRNATYGYDLPWRQGIQRGRWTDFAYHMKLSSNPAVGYVELYLNTGGGWHQQTLAGQKRLYMRTLDSSNGGGANNFRINNYRKRGMFNVATLYHAEPKVGTTFDSVAPGSYE